MSDTYLESLPPLLIEQSQTDSHALWGDGLTLEKRIQRLVWLTTRFPSHLKMSGWVNGAGELIGSLKRYQLELKVNGEVVPTVGLGAVFTHPTARGKGIAERLIRRVLESERKDGTRAALLFSDISPAYYERFGFRRFPAERGRGTNTDLPSGKPFRLRKADASEAEKLRQWYEASFSASLVRPTRKKEHWALYRARVANDDDWVLLDDEKEVGFLNYVLLPDRLWVEEWGGPAPLRDRVWATVRELSLENRRSEVGAWLRPDERGMGLTTHLRDKAVPMIASLESSFSVDGIDAANTYFASLDHF